MEFRERLYQLRKGRGISQEELAHTVGVSRQAVQKWEAGAATPDLSNLSALADYVYGHVFVRYTMKQWGQTPEEIDPNTTARVPVFLSEDCRYFQDAYQGMPLEGYTPMFQSLLDHPDITVELGVDARERLTLGEDGLALDGVPFAGPAPSSIPARRTSCSAANTAACPTAPWTSALRPTRWTSGRATER